MVKDEVILGIKNNQLFFRVNYDQEDPDFNFEPNKNHNLFKEYETLHTITKVIFVCIRKI